MLVKFLILIFIIYIKSIFTSAETAFTYLRKAKINQISKGKRANKKTKRIKELLDNKQKLFGTTKIGMTFAELFVSVFAAEAFVSTITKELLNYITLVGIKVPYADIYGGRSIGISFDCSWDEENGLGLRLNNEEVIDVGYQDIAI